MYRKKTYAGRSNYNRNSNRRQPQDLLAIPVMYISIHSEKPHGLPLGIYSAFDVMLTVLECYIILLARRNI